MKHNNQYNFRLLQSAKIAPRMHQNAPFPTQKSKKILGDRCLWLWRLGPSDGAVIGYVLPVLWLRHVFT